MREWWNGRHQGLVRVAHWQSGLTLNSCEWVRFPFRAPKIPWARARAGSSPVSRTIWRFGEQVNTPGFDPAMVGAVPTTAATLTLRGAPMCVQGLAYVIT